MSLGPHPERLDLVESPGRVESDRVVFGLRTVTYLWDRKPRRLRSPG